jgi:hypothetical protein
LLAVSKELKKPPEQQPPHLPAKPMNLAACQHQPLLLLKPQHQRQQQMIPQHKRPQRPTLVVQQ